MNGGDGMMAPREVFTCWAIEGTLDAGAVDTAVYASQASANERMIPYQEATGFIPQ